MAFDISYIFQAIDKFTRPARAILQSTKRLEGAYNSLNKVAKYGAELQNKSKYVMAGTALAIVGLGASLLHTAGTFQQLNISFAAMIGNQKEADNLFKAMIEMSQKFGAATTIEFGTAARSLLAVGGSAKEIPTVLGKLADIASLAGLSLETVAQNYAQAFATGRVQRQYIQGLIKSTTILESMGKVLHKTKEQTANLLTQGKITFPTLAKAITLMASSTGQFFEGQKKNAHTIFGAYNVVRDALQVVRNNMGKFLLTQFHLTDAALKFRDAMKKVNDNFGFYAKKYGGLVKLIIEGLVAFAALTTFNFLLGTVMRSVTIIMWIYRGAILAVRGAMMLWRVASMALAVAQGLALAPLILFVSIIGLILYGIFRLLKHFNLWKGTMYTLGKAVTEYLVNPFKHLIDMIGNAIKAIKKFVSASAILKKTASIVAIPFTAAGEWIGSKIPVPKGVTAIMHAQHVIAAPNLPSVYHIGKPKGMPLTVAEGGSAEVMKLYRQNISLFKSTFPKITAFPEAQPFPKMAPPNIVPFPKIASPLIEPFPKMASPQIVPFPKVIAPAIASFPTVKAPAIISFPKVKYPEMAKIPKLAAPEMSPFLKISSPELPAINQMVIPQVTPLPLLTPLQSPLDQVAQDIMPNKTDDLVSALQQAFPNLNEGLQTEVQVTIEGKEEVKAHSPHAGTYPHFDVGVNMPLAAGGSV